MVTYFPKPLNKQVAAISDSLARTQKGLGIGASGDTHDAIGSGQFVYVRDHSSLAEGLYKSKAAIAQDGALSTSNLTADDSGGLNDLQSQITALNSNLMYNFVQAVYAINTSNTITIPKKGVYLVSLLAQKGSVAGGTHSITQNGYFVAGCETHQNEQYVSMTIPLSCNQGDIIGFTTTVPFVSTPNKHSCQLAVAFITYA